MGRGGWAEGISPTRSRLKNSRTYKQFLWHWRKSSFERPVTRQGGAKHFCLLSTFVAGSPFHFSFFPPDKITSVDQEMCREKIFSVFLFFLRFLFGMKKGFRAHPTDAKYLRMKNAAKL